MIDWLTVEIPLVHVQINDGAIINYDRDNSPIYSIDKRLRVESSHSTSVQVKSGGTRTFEGLFTHLIVDGNLNKFFNGHNIVGTDDVCSLVFRLVEFLIADGVLILDPRLLKTQTLQSYPRWHHPIIHGDFIVKRIDINYMFKVNGGDVSEYIDFLSDTTRTRFSRTTQPGSGSVYWNQKSTHWAMKAYDKHKELNARKKSHRLPESWPSRVVTAIHDLVKPYVRFELVLRARHLRAIAEKNGYNQATYSAFMYPRGDAHNEYLKRITPADLFSVYFEKIEVSEMSRFQVDDAINKLSHSAYGTFAAWRSGINVRIQLKRPTYYRHRKEIIENLGVDIALSNTNVERHAGTTAKVFKLVIDDGSKLEKQISKLLEAC